MLRLEGGRAALALGGVKVHAKNGPWQLYINGVITTVNKNQFSHLFSAIFRGFNAIYIYLVGAHLVVFSEVK